MNKIGLMLVVSLALIFSAFSAELPEPEETNMRPITIAEGGTLNASWVKECEAKVRSWKASMQPKLVSLGVVGSLEAKPEFELNETVDREPDSSCYDRTTTLYCQLEANLEDPQFRLSQLARSIKLSSRSNSQMQLCSNFLAQVKNLPETLSATSVVMRKYRKDPHLSCVVISLAVTKL